MENKVSGPIVSKKIEQAPNQDESDVSEEKESASTAKLETPPGIPYYDAEKDVILAYAKRIYFIGADIMPATTSRADYGVEYSFELPAPFVPVPLSGPPAAESLGAHESLVWSVRWFARSLLEGSVYTQLADWFPKRLKVSTPTRMVTLSWGL